MTDQLSRQAVYQCKANWGHDINEWEISHTVNIPKVEGETQEDTNKRFYDAAKSLEFKISGCPKAKYVKLELSRVEMTDAISEELSRLFKNDPSSSLKKLDVAARIAVKSLQIMMKSGIHQGDIPSTAIKGALAPFELDEIKAIYTSLCKGPMADKSICK